MATKQSKRSVVSSVFGMKCPHCRTGNMFRSKNPWNLKKIFDMNDHCECCGQPFELEVGFYYGTGYVSYALSVGFSVATAVAWYFLVGFTSYNQSFLHWLLINIGLLVLFQPYFMRLSRSIYIHFFVSYDPYAIQRHEAAKAIDKG